ncbi:tetratricopeptide repeat protein [Micromonospora sp. NBC_00330]|uniref:AfsR/SARP family transcriptional regulator n=1 Tax=Micromonospora sp. NBC_00330 TaxID=2903585 RepID=UPI002E28156B|nr:BTAD domain-containing putative transcriptional regulator [Micromonospora sp. NBC_00330]
MEIQLLGGLSVHLLGRKLHLGTPKQQAVFAMLAVQPGQLVTVNDLVDELWPDGPPRSAVANVRTYAANLRRTFETFDSGQGVIVRQQSGYQLTLEPEAIDVFRFEMEFAAGREALITGHVGRALARLASAVARWRGPMLAGMSLGPVLGARVVAAEEERLLAVELFADAQLRVGRSDLAIPLLREAVARHPLREPAYALLTRALHERGDHAGALVVYDEVRTKLMAELGVLPGSDLQALHRTIVSAVPSQRTAKRAAPRPAGPSARRVSEAASPGGVPVPERAAPRHDPVDHLPRAVTDFVGREDMVSRLLAETRRVEERVPAVHIIDGMAGSGKTTLAVHLARRLADRYPDAALFIDLCGHGEKGRVEPASALVTLLRQLGVPAGRVPVEFDDRVELWRQELARRRSVVVLDNAASSEQIMPLLPAEPTTVVLVTSRQRLSHPDVGPSQTLPLLNPQESLDLLSLSIGRDRVEAESEAAAEVVRRCGYLPLAIRLAGARLAHRRGWRLADLAEQMAGDAAVLHHLAQEESTVTGAFAASYEPLPSSTKRVFRFLGLYPGSRFGPPAVAALTGLTIAEARAALDDLVDRNLVEDLDSTRYRLHDLMRQYSIELCSRTDSASDRKAGLAHLFDFTLAVALKVAKTLEPNDLEFRVTHLPFGRPELVDAIGEPTADWLEAERTDLVTMVRAALDEGFHEHSWRLARALWRFCYIRGYFEDIITTHRHALTAADASGDVGAAALMNNYLASGYIRTGNNREALHHLTRAVALSEDSRDVLRTARYRANLAAVYYWSGNLTEAVRVGLERLRDYKGYGKTKVPMALPNLGMALTSLGRYEEALRIHRLHLAWARTNSDVFHTLNALSHIGAVRVRMGDLPQAIRILLASLALRDRTGHRYAEAEVRNDLGIAYRGLGRLVEAQQEHELARKLSIGSGERHVEAAALNELGRTLLAQGRGGEASEVHQEALRLATRIAHPHEQGRALAGLAEHFARVDPAEARRHWERALAIFRRMGVPERFEAERRLAELTGATVVAER